MLAHQNPFRASRIEAIPFIFQEGSWDEVFLKLEALNFRSAVVGPHGSGKTVFLEQLRQRLLEKGFSTELIRLTAGKNYVNRSDLGKLSNAEIALIDGAEQLNWLSWQFTSRQLKKNRGIIISTHSSGRLPTLYRCQASLALFSQILEQLGASIVHTNFHAAKLFHKHQGNIREALFELYSLSSID